MIPGHSASATIWPRCSRRPEMRAERSTRDRLPIVHGLAAEVVNARSFKSAHTERSDSPPSTLTVASRITAASSGTTWSRSRVYP